MPAFVVIAWDGTDEGALARRMAARPGHMEAVAPMARDGRLVLGGALLDAPEGKMVGSVAVVDLPDEAAVRAWIAGDPYGEVWRDVSIHPFRVAPLPYRPLPGSEAEASAARPDALPPGVAPAEAGLAALA